MTPVAQSMNYRAALAALTDSRGLCLSVPQIAGIARANTAAVRDWHAGRAAPTDAACLRLHIGARVLDALAFGRVSSPGVACMAGPLTFADLFARHCRAPRPGLHQNPEPDTIVARYAVR